MANLNNIDSDSRLLTRITSPRFIFFTQTCLIILCITGVIRRFIQIGHAGKDSWAPMAAALDYLHGPDSDQLFNVIFFDAGIKFQYPPSSLIMLEPLRILGLNSKMVLNAFNFTFLIGNAVICALLANALFLNRHSERFRGIILAGAFFMGIYYQPIAIGYGYGQVQILLNLLFTAALLLMLQGSDRIAGALLGFGATIKPQLAPLLIFSALQKRWGFAISFLTCGGIIGLLSLFLYGFDNHLAYLDVLRFLSERGESYHGNASINGIMHRMLGAEGFEVASIGGIEQSTLPPYNPVVAWATRLSFFIFMGVALLMPRGIDDRISGLLYFCIASLCLTVSSPVAWVHHYGILLPMYFIALHSILQGPYKNHIKPRLLLLVVSLALSGGKFPQFRESEGVFTLLQVPVFFGACTLLAILVFELCQRSRLMKS